jgi:hypothetical protein
MFDAQTLYNAYRSTLDVDAWRTPETIVACYVAGPEPRQSSAVFFGEAAERIARLANVTTHVETLRAPGRPSVSVTMTSIVSRDARVFLDGLLRGGTPVVSIGKGWGSWKAQ